MALLVLLFQVAMAAAILLHPRVIAACVNFFLRIREIQVEVHGVHLFSLRLSGLRFRQGLDKVEVAWMGFKFSSLLSHYPMVIWVDGLVIESHGKVKSNSPPEIAEEPACPPAQKGVTLPGSIALFVRLCGISISDLLVSVVGADGARQQLLICSVDIAGRHRTDLPSQRLSFNTFMRSIEIVSGNSDPLEDDDASMLRSVYISECKLGVDMELADPRRVHARGLRITRIPSLLCACGEISVAGSIPTKECEDKEVNSVGPDSGRGATAKQPVLVLHHLIPSCATFSAALFQLTLNCGSASSAGEVDEKAGGALVISTRCSLGRDQGQLPEGDAAVTLKWLLDRSFEKDPVLASAQAPSVTIGAYLSTLNFSSLGRGVTVHGLHLKPVVEVKKTILGDTLGSHSWEVALCAHTVRIEGVRGFVGSRLAKWIARLNARETSMRRRAGSRIERLMKQGLPAPQGPPKPSISLSIDSVQVDIQQPPEAALLACTGPNDVSDTIYAITASSIQVEQVAQNATSDPGSKDPGSKVLFVNVGVQSACILMGRHEKLKVGALHTSITVDTTMTFKGIKASRRVERTLGGETLKAELDATIEFLSGKEGAGSRHSTRLLEAENLRHRQVKVMHPIHGAYSEIVTELRSLWLNWSGTCHVTIMRLAQRLPATIDMILGEYSASRSRNISRTVILEKCSLCVSASDDCPPILVDIVQLQTLQHKSYDKVTQGDHYSSMDFQIQEALAKVPGWATVTKEVGEISDLPGVPILLMRDLRLCMSRVGSSALDCKKSMSVAAEALHVTLPPCIELGNLRQALMRQHRLAEIELAEPEGVPATSHAFDMDIKVITLLCLRETPAGNGDTLKMRVGRRTTRNSGGADGEPATRKGVPERAISEGWGASLQSGVVDNGVLAFVVADAVYKVSRDEPCDVTLSKLQILDSDPSSQSLSYRSIMGGDANFTCKDIETWAAGCDTPIVSAKLLNGSGKLLQATIADTPKLPTLHLTLSTAEGHPLRGQRVVSIETDTAPTKLYVDMSCGLEGLSIIQGACLEVPIQMLTAASVRLMPGGDAVSSEAGLPPPPVLGLWDRLRMLVHGRLALAAQNASYTQLQGCTALIADLPECLRIVAGSVDVTYTVGQFDFDLRKWILSTPGRLREAQLHVRSPSHRRPSSQNSDDDWGWRFIPSLDAEARAAIAQEQRLGIFGVRHCAVFVPAARLTNTLQWDCQSCAPLSHHTRNTRDYVATGLRLKTSMHATTNSDVEQALWLAFRLDLMEWLLPRGVVHGGSQEGYELEADVTEQDNATPSMGWGDLFNSVDFDLSLTRASAAIWRGDGATSSGFVLSVDLVEASAIPPLREQSREGTFEFLLGHVVFNLLDMDEVMRRWRCLMVDKWGLDAYGMAEEDCAWMLVSALEEATKSVKLFGAGASSDGSYVMGAESLAFRSGRLNVRRGTRKDTARDGGNGISFSHFFQTPLRHRDAIRGSPMAPGVLRPKSWASQATRSLTAQIGRSAEAPAGPIPSVSWDSALGDKEGQGGFSAHAKRVVVVDKLKLLWTIPIRDAVVLLVADLLQRLSPPSTEDTGIDVPQYVSTAPRPAASPEDDVGVERLESIAANRLSSSSQLQPVGNLSPALQGLKSRDSSFFAQSSLSPSSPGSPPSDDEDLLSWLESRQEEQTISHCSNVEGDGEVEPTADMSAKPPLLPRLSSDQRLSTNRVSAGSKAHTRHITPHSSSQNTWRGQDASVVSPFSPLTNMLAGNPMKAVEASQDPKQASYVQIDHLVDYEVQLLSPQVKLRSVKASLVLSVQHASVQARTYQTVYLSSPNNVMNASISPGRHPVPSSSSAQSSSSEIDTEVGPQRRKEISVKLSEARVYALPTDIDTCGASRWVGEEEGSLDDCDPEQSAASRLFGGGRVLREVMRPFKVTTSYQFYEVVPQLELLRLVQQGLQAKPLSQDALKTLSLDVPEVYLNVDSEQFYQVLDVVRHLLLAPPPAERLEAMQRRREKRRRSSCLSSGAQAQSPTRPERTGKGAPKPKSFYDVGYKADRELLKVIVEEALEVGSKVAGRIVKNVSCINYYIGRCTWRLMMSPQVMESEGITDKLEVGLTGFSAKHTYMSVLRPNAKAIVYQDALMQVERLWINNLCPGPDASACFADATSILGVQLPDREPCQRCGAFYDAENNWLDSCSHHGMENGRLGDFHVSPGTESARWTCCGAAEEDAPGCLRRPHIAKEVMLTLRAQGGPSVLAAATPVSVFKHVEVNMFPSASYTLVLQLTRGVAALLQRYFNLEEPQDAKEAGVAVLPHVLAGGSLTGPRGPMDDSSHTRHGTNSTDNLASASMLLGGKRRASNTSTKKTADDTDVPKDGQNPQEALYLKYFRLGDINLNVSVNGFKLIKLDGYGVEVKPFTRWSKVISWQRLVWKLVWHISRAVTKKALKPSVGIFRSPPAGASTHASSLLKSLEKSNHEKEKGMRLKG